MKQTITDTDVLIIASLATALAPDYSSTADNPWIGSPFEWILKVPSRTKGAIGESLMAGWAAAKGFDVQRSRNSSADRIVHGHRIEIKMSTLWKTGVFKFQQIRDQDYDYCLCVGFSPFDVQAWLLPKKLLDEFVIGHMGQHTGATGTDTSWLSFQAASAYDWMSPYGDRLSTVEQLLNKIGKGNY